MDPYLTLIRFIISYSLIQILFKYYVYMYPYIIDIYVIIYVNLNTYYVCLAMVCH
jgi:hypothetical protein